MLLDAPEECDVLGVKTDCYHHKDAVTKEVLKVGDGKVKPSLGHLCRIKYIAYFFDKQIFDTSPEDGNCETEVVIGDISWPEGLWRGLQHMRRDETSKIRIKKKFAFGRPGEV